jgi:hypothetical protein
LYTDEKKLSTQIQIDRGGAFKKKEDFFKTYIMQQV